MKTQIFAMSSNVTFVADGCCWLLSVNEKCQCFHAVVAFDEFR